MSNNQLPKTIRNIVWNREFGNKSNIELCYCCSTETITRANYHCGHIISRNCGGSDDIDNLKPICAQCNLSMGINNMHEFMKKYGLFKLKANYVPNNTKLINVPLKQYHEQFLIDVKLQRIRLTELHNNKIFSYNLYNDYKIWINNKQYDYLLTKKEFKKAIEEYLNIKFKIMTINENTRTGINLTSYFNNVEDLNNNELKQIIIQKDSEIKKLNDKIKKFIKGNLDVSNFKNTNRSVINMLTDILN